MLVLSRRRGESIVIGDDVELRVDHIGRRNVRLVITAPPEIRVLRGEQSGDIEEPASLDTPQPNDPPA